MKMLACVQSVHTCTICNFVDVIDFSLWVIFDKKKTKPLKIHDTCIIILMHVLGAHVVLLIHCALSVF